MSRPTAPAGRLFAVAAFLEGFTWIGLLIGMWLKYGAETTDLGVRIFGPLHGGAFLFYVAVTLLCALRLRWPWWASLLALVAAVPPLVTVPLEMWLRRLGLLGESTTNSGVGVEAGTPPRPLPDRPAARQLERS